MIGRGCGVPRQAGLLLVLLRRHVAVTVYQRTARLRTSLSTRLSTPTLVGRGTLVEVSRTGGLLEVDASWKPAVGAPVSLAIESAGSPPVMLAASVVRHTETGFAVAFDSVTVELLMLLESLGPS